MAAGEKKPAGPLWVRNLRDLIVIVGVILGFATISVVATPYLPKSAWVVIISVGSAVLYIVIMSLARKKAPIQQSPQRNAGSRPSSDDSPASESSSSLGPRG